MRYLYPNLVRLLRDKRISAPMYAAVLEVSPSAAQKKIRGEFDHTFSEAKKAMDGIFPEYSMDYIFQREDSIEERARANNPEVW